MSVTDPIADFLTRIRNAQMALHETVVAPHSKVNEEIVKILKEEGYVAAYKVEEQRPYKTISVVLKYVGDREPAIRKLQRVSTPGRRIYVRKGEIPPVLGGLGINIVSTSKGLFTGKNAVKEGLGGELLCEVY